MTDAHEAKTEKQNAWKMPEGLEATAVLEKAGLLSAQNMLERLVYYYPTRYALGRDMGSAIRPGIYRDAARVLLVQHRIPHGWTRTGYWYQGPPAKDGCFSSHFYEHEDERDIAAVLAIENEKEKS